jgi:hypothetical protein
VEADDRRGADAVIVWSLLVTFRVLREELLLEPRQIV